MWTKNKKEKGTSTVGTFLYKFLLLLELKVSFQTNYGSAMLTFPPFTAESIFCLVFHNNAAMSKPSYQFSKELTQQSDKYKLLLLL